MAVFALPSIPESIYRIQSADRLNPALYLERQSDGEIKPAVLDTANTNQQWRIVYQDDGTYRIVNAKTYDGLSLLAWQQKDQTYYRLWSGGPRHVWTFDPNGNAFIIGDPTTASCLDIQPNNWVVSQMRTNTASQRWILHTVEPDGLKAEKFPSDNVKPNSYHPDNVKEDGSAGWKQPSLSSNEYQSAPAIYSPPRSITPRIPSPTSTPVSAPILANGNYDIINVSTGDPFYPGLSGNLTELYFLHTKRYFRPPGFPMAWTLERIPSARQDMYCITGSLYGHPVSLFTFRSFGVPGGCTFPGDAVLCNDGQRTCRLVPTRSPGCFHLVVEAGGMLRAVSVSTEPLDGNTFTMEEEFNAEDTHQHWRFVPA